MIIYHSPLATVYHADARDAESSSRQGETVLDPFGGIGSTAVAAILAGRRAITIDVNREYAYMARDRIIAAEALALAGTTT